MSGGRFDYKDSELKSEIYGWTDEPENVFEDMEISELVWDVLDLIHDFDWYASGDTCKETYLKAKAEFKKKWFSANHPSHYTDGKIEILNASNKVQATN